MKEIEGIYWEIYGLKTWSIEARAYPEFLKGGERVNNLKICIKFRY